MFVKAYVTQNLSNMGAPLELKKWSGPIYSYALGSLAHLQNAEALTLSQSSKFFRVGIMPMVYLPGK